MVSLTANEKEVIFAVFRRVIYLFMTIGFIFFLYFLARQYHGRTFVEHGVVENIQLLILFLTAVIFVGEALILKKSRVILLCLTSLCCLGFCRELDCFFDITMPTISWKFGFLFPLGAMINLCFHWKETCPTFFYFLQTPAFNMMVMAIMILILAQCMGHRPFIITVMGTTSKARAVRRFFEEGIEIVGYFVLLLSSFECYWNLRHRLK